MLSCVQHAHHANSFSDTQSPQPQLFIFSHCASIASSPVSWTCLSAVAEQSILGFQGSLAAGVHKECTGGQLPSELAICLLSACASCSEIFLNCFFFAFSGKYLPMKADMKSGMDEYGGLSAVRCSMSPRERTQDTGGWSSVTKLLCVPL